MFQLFKDKAIISRLSYENNKSSLILTGKYYMGYLVPISPKDALYQGAFGKDFTFTTKVNADIQEGDQLEIDGANYNVKGEVPYKGITILYKKLLLVKK